MLRVRLNSRKHVKLAGALLFLSLVVLLAPIGSGPQQPVDGPRATEDPASEDSSDLTADIIKAFHSESSDCYVVQSHGCSQSAWSQSETRGIHIGSENHIHVRVLHPGLWGQDTLSLVLCDPEQEDPNTKGILKKRTFIRHDGCQLALEEERDDISFRSSASWYKHAGRYFHGFVALEAADFSGHFIVTRGGELILEAEDSSSTFRVDASWLVSPASQRDDSDTFVGVYLLKQPVAAGTDVPNFIEDTTTCAREHHGCCDITESSFVTPQTTEMGPADPATSEVAAIILSSKNTIDKRRSLLDRWLLDPIQNGQTAPWARAVISLECFTDGIDTSLLLTDWVVGPLGDGPRGIPAITVRVPLVTHWTFEKYPDSSWYLTIDDDTLVFSSNVMWALSWLDLPHSKLWYVGHSTEWKIKVYFHGKMAFGGGGILISNYGRKLWMDTWQGGYLNASRTWLTSGRCSHDGGDGTVCRCLQIAAGVRDMFTDFRGFHQFDIVGTKSMLDIIKDTCPSCPSVYEQTGLWLDDIVSQHTLCTFHHLLAIENGAIYPGLNGSTTGLMFYDAYEAYTHHLLLKRACGRSENATYTLCINFGHQLQIYRPELDPEDAFVLMDVKDGTGRERPTENLIYLAVKQHVQNAQLCSMHYQFGGTQRATLYIGSHTKPRAEHDPPCLGRARVVVKDLYMTCSIQFGRETIVWKQQLYSHAHGFGDG